MPSAASVAPVTAIVPTYNRASLIGQALDSILSQSRPPAGRLWPGIVTTLLLWLIAGRIFAAYLARFANYTATYAGLASVVTAIFFLYLIALIMIFGAEFNAALGRLRAGKLR